MRPPASIRAPFALSLVLLAATACAGAGEDAADVAAPTASDRETPPAASRALATTILRLPAATAFGEPGFHETLVATAVLPDDIPAAAGRTLAVSLRDAGRPNQECSQQHPLSGCATVDWSDDESRPNVPPGGVFENRITIDLTSGTRSFFLSESGALADAPDAFEPG